MKEVFTSGAIVNFLTVAIGSLLGLLCRKGISEKLHRALMTGMALCVLYIGISGMLNDGVKILAVVLSMAIGAILGELADLDSLVNQIGKKLENSLNKSGKNGSVAEGFVTSTLLFCVGAMTIVGSIDAGVSGDNATLYAKALIDGISAVALTASLGIGVIFSTLPVVILEGGLTLLASAAQPILTDDTVTQMSTVGSLLIVAIGLNLLGITKIKVMNFVPAIFLPIILCLIL